MLTLIDIILEKALVLKVVTKYGRWPTQKYIPKLKQAYNIIYIRLNRRLKSLGGLITKTRIIRIDTLIFKHLSIDYVILRANKMYLISSRNGNTL